MFFIYQFCLNHGIHLGVCDSPYIIDKKQNCQNNNLNDEVDDQDDFIVDNDDLTDDLILNLLERL
jgi:hypothetical protein